MMRRGTLFILGHRVKDQGQLWHSVFKTWWIRCRLQFLPNHFQTLHTSCGWWEEEPYWFGVMGSKVKVNFGTLRARYRLQFLPNHFQTLQSCKLCMMRGGTLWYGVMGSKVKFIFGTKIKPCGHDTLFILGHEVKCCGQPWSPARGCNALRCLVANLDLNTIFQTIIVHVLRMCHDLGPRLYVCMLISMSQDVSWP